MDINRATIVGRLTRDPESRVTQNGINVTSFGVATNFVWTDQNGERKESVEFHNVVAWRKLGEIVSQYLRKGSRVLVEGRLQTRSWDGQDGVKRNRTEIIADNVIMLDSRGAGGGAISAEAEMTSYSAPTKAQSEPVISPKAAEPPAQISQSPQPQTEEINVEDIPF